MSTSSCPPAARERVPGRTSPLSSTATPHEGRSWRLRLSADGTRTTRLPTPGTTPATAVGEDAADASLRGTAGELVLARYGRIPVDSLKVDGDRRLFDLLLEWNPDA